MLNKKKGLIIFDLDGVLLNSEKNMDYAWTKTCKKLHISIKFDKYKKYVGLGFFEILKKLRINKNKHLEAYKFYNLYSKNGINKMKLFPHVKKVLKKIKSTYEISLFTSKNKSRVNKILIKFNLNFSKVITLDDVSKPKPSPEGLNKIIKCFKFKKKDIFYVGDTFHDFKAAQSANINYIHCNWGFKKLKKKIYYLNRMNDLIKLLKL